MARLPLITNQLFGKNRLPYRYNINTRMLPHVVWPAPPSGASQRAHDVAATSHEGHIWSQRRWPNHNVAATSQIYSSPTSHIRCHSNVPDATLQLWRSVNVHIMTFQDVTFFDVTATSHYATLQLWRSINVHIKTFQDVTFTMSQQRRIMSQVRRYNCDVPSTSGQRVS